MLPQQIFFSCKVLPSVAPFSTRACLTTSLICIIYSLGHCKIGHILLELGESKHMALIPQSSEASPEITLWERMGKAVELDIESSKFSWERLVSLHRTEHRSSTEHSEDEMSKPIEVTVNSGGMVFFALFENCEGNDSEPKEGVAVIKIPSSRMGTQSERLGYAFAEHLGVLTPQIRVVHNSSFEWQNIKDATEKARRMARAAGADVGESTCTELLEALELSRCLLLIGYVHGFPLLQSSHAFNNQEAAQNTAAALGRILVLDLILRNEDRLPCRQLGWRGNPANLLFTEKLLSRNSVASVQGNIESLQRNKGSAFSDKERRLCSGGLSNSHLPAVPSQNSDTADWPGSVCFPKAERCNLTRDFHIVAIDSGVPRWPPAGKRLADNSQYPKLVELLLNSADFASNLLYEISGEKLGFQVSGEARAMDVFTPENIDQVKVTYEFQLGFHAGLRQMQLLHVFLLKLQHKLDELLRTFVSIISQTLPGDEEKEVTGAIESGCLSSSFRGSNCQHPVTVKECLRKEQNPDAEDLTSSNGTCSHELFSKPSSKSPHRDNMETMSPASRDSWHGRNFKGNGDPFHPMRLILKLKDLNKTAKMDGELNKVLEHWNEMLATEAIKLCQERSFNTGFFEGGDAQTVIDSYELKVRLDHLLERMALISQAVDTERPSPVTDCLYIGGALAARSINTLKFLCVTHVLCLCPNELGQSEAQYPELFEYRNFEICDVDDANISHIFEDASDFIESVEKTGGKILVHCFEGKSRSSTVVLAYLMLRKRLTLNEAWIQLKVVHQRAQPNDGFMRTLIDLDKRLYGKSSMDWQRRKPVMRSCPICSKIVGLSSSSMKLHLQKSHRLVSSKSADSIEVKELQQILDSVMIGC